MKIKRLLLAMTITSFILAGCGDKKTDAQKKVDEMIGDDISIMENVRDDTTGNFRYVSIVSSASAEEWADDYYKAYFKDKDEIHFIVNFGNKTTNVIRTLASDKDSPADGGIIDLTIKEHVDKEELSAKTLGDGMMYGEYMIDTDTGKVEQLN